MATISSTGIGSGLDVNSIVSQLVALEKQPLKSLAVKATNVTNQISSFGQIQSQISALTDVATRISAASAWSARNATSSNSSVATITATGAATATTLSLEVTQLAQQQSVSSGAMPLLATPGVGQLALELGTWASDINGAKTFTAAVPLTPPATPPTINVAANDTLAAIAFKINAAGAGVTASVFNDGEKERLMLTSTSTGAAAGFRVQAFSEPVSPATVGAPITDNTGLGQLAFDPGTLATKTTGMADAANPIQYAQNAKARINGLDVSSASNTLTNNVAGVTLNLVATTTLGSPITLSIKEDVTPAVKNVNDFVTAYNTLNATLASLTKYDAATKTAGLFQGDSSITGLQNLLRNMAGSASLGASSQRLSDLGIERQLDGSLSINTAKLSVAANKGTTLQQLFTADNGNATTNGFALKFKTLGKGLLATGGTVANKSAALQKNLASNTAAQTSMTDKAALFETRLRARYSALDVQMASLNAINAYVAQQVTSWNKSTA